MKPPCLPYGEPDLYSNYILKNPDFIDHFCINFPCHCVLNQVDSDTNLLDNMLLAKNILQPTKRPRSVGPHKSKSEKTTSKKESHLQNKKISRVSIQLCEEPRSVKLRSYEPAKSRSGEENMLQQHLFNTDEDPKNRPFINTGASIPIITCRFTKNSSYVVSGKSISSRSQYSGSNQRFNVDVESSSLPEKNAELFCCLVTRLVFTSKIFRPDIQACVAYILTRMELPMKYHKDRHLDIDILFMNKTQTVLMLPLDDRCMYFKMLFSKHNKYILNILQQIIQSQRLKNVFTVVEGTLKNMID